MLGGNCGIGSRLKNDYTTIILWHCLNHRLQLILNDSVNDIKQVNYFKVFMHKNLHNFSPIKQKPNATFQNFRNALATNCEDR